MVKTCFFLILSFPLGPNFIPEDSDEVDRRGNFESRVKYSKGNGSFSLIN